jgi:arylsulfatase A-like enzyme
LLRRHLFCSDLVGGRRQAAKHGFLYWEFHETDQIGVRMGDWKLLVKKGTPYLYDLANDVHEDHDIAAAHPDIVKQMKEIIKREHRDSEMFPVTLPDL